VQERWYRHALLQFPQCSFITCSEYTPKWTPPPTHTHTHTTQTQTHTHTHTHTHCIYWNPRSLLHNSLLLILNSSKWSVLKIPHPSVSTAISRLKPVNCSEN
jgi:hypothetical protein